MTSRQDVCDLIVRLELIKAREHIHERSKHLLCLETVMAYLDRKPYMRGEKKRQIRFWYDRAFDWERQTALASAAVIGEGR
jgi:hypothetical protein